MRYLVLVVLLSFIACSEPTSVDPMVCDARCRANAEVFDPPPFYGDLWAIVESCSGSSGDWYLIHWFLVGQATESSAVIVNLCPEAPGGCAGRWDPPHDVYLNRWYALYDQASNFWTVRHEMLHDLLQGDPSHTSPSWKACRLAP